MVTASTAAIIAATLGACDDSANTTDIVIELYTPFQQEALLVGPPTGSADQIEALLVQDGLPGPLGQGDFTIANRTGRLNGIHEGQGFRVLVRGFLGAESAEPVFYGSTLPFDIVAGEPKTVSIMVGASNCLGLNKVAPSTPAESGSTDLSTQRTGFAMTALSDGRVLISGGAKVDPQGNIIEVLDLLEIYDPGRGNFQRLEAPFNLLSPRAHHTATLLDDGKILIVGGLTVTNPGAANQTIEAVRLRTIIDLDDPVSPVKPVGQPFEAGEQRSHHRATKLPDGTVLITGGELNRVPQASAYRYLPSTAGFVRQGNLCDARSQHSTTFAEGGLASVVVAGGLGSPDGATASILDSVEVYTTNPEQSAACCGGATASAQSGCFFRAPDVALATPRFGHAAVAVDTNRQVLFVGGYASLDRNESADALEMLAGNLTMRAGVGALPATGGELTASVVPNGTVLVLGGRRGDNPTLDSYSLIPQVGAAGGLGDPPVERFATTTLDPLCDLSEQRFGHSAVTLSTGAVLVAGGVTLGANGYVTSGRAELYFPRADPIRDFYPAEASFTPPPIP